MTITDEMSGAEEQCVEPDTGEPADTEITDASEGPNEHEDEDVLSDFTVTDGGDSGSQGGIVSDTELKQIAEGLQTTITVIGCGGAGGNAVTRIKAAEEVGATCIGLNTDAQHLAKEVVADEKLLVGRDVTNGRGAGSVPRVGMESAEENSGAIRNAVTGSDLVFITAGLGGGTGTGTAPVVADIANQEGALTVAAVTLPFSDEGKLRRNNAVEGLKRLRETADTVVVIENDQLLEYAPNLSLNDAFKVCDRVLQRTVTGINHLIETPGLVNLDFADVKTILQNGGTAMVGIGESTDPTARAQHAISDTINSPLLNTNLSGAERALVNVSGGHDMTVDEAETAVAELSNRMSPQPRIIWGATVNDELEDEIRTMAVVTGASTESSPNRHR